MFWRISNGASLTTSHNDSEINATQCVVWRCLRGEKI